MKNLETRQNALNDHSEGMSVTEVCKKYGISRPTFYDWMNNSKVDERELTKEDTEGVMGAKVRGYLQEIRELRLEIKNLKEQNETLMRTLKLLTDGK